MAEPFSEHELVPRDAPGIGRVRAYASHELRRLKKIQQRNVRIFRQRPLQEMSGAFGYAFNEADIATLLRNALVIWGL